MYKRQGEKRELLQGSEWDSHGEVEEKRLSLGLSWGGGGRFAISDLLYKSTLKAFTFSGH